MDRNELAILMDRRPRAALAHLPTPLERYGDLLVKRDDQTGLAFGGSKLRTLEFLLGDALRQGAKVLVTAGSPQSNHCRLTAAAAARCGLQCRLLVIGADRGTGHWGGNELVSSVFGAETIAVDRASAREEVDDYVARLRHGSVPFYYIEEGGHTPLALWGYLGASLELLAQLEAGGTMPERVFLACGRGTTQAGLLLGLRLLGCGIPILGVSVARDRDRCREEIREIIGRFCRDYEVENPVVESDIEVDDRWIGSGYDVVPAERWQVVTEQARRRGLLLDPVYTSRAMQALLERAPGSDGPIPLLIHTGGLPGLLDPGRQNGPESPASRVSSERTAPGIPGERSVE